MEQDQIVIKTRFVEGVPIIDIDRNGRADWLRGLGGGICLDLGNGRGEFAEKSHFLATSDDRRSEVLCLPVDIDGDGRTEPAIIERSS